MLRIRPGGQAAKTPPFHGGNTSSILVRVTRALKKLRALFFCMPIKNNYAENRTPLGEAEHNRILCEAKSTRQSLVDSRPGHQSSHKSEGFIFLYAYIQ